MMLPQLLKAFKEHVPFFIAGGALLAFFYIFSFFVKEDAFTQIDFNLTHLIQNKIPVRFDPFLSWFSILGSFEVTVGILIVLTLVKLARKKILAILLVPAFGVMHVVEIIGKAFLDHPGTPFLFHRYALDFTFPSSYVQPGGSYPSGHSMRSAYLAVLFVYLIVRSKKLSAPQKGVFSGIIIAILVVMLVSRVSLGEHWTTDVVGGTLLATAFALFSLILLENPLASPKKA